MPDSHAPCEACRRQSTAFRAHALLVLVRVWRPEVRAGRVQQLCACTELGGTARAQQAALSSGWQQSLRSCSVSLFGCFLLLLTQLPRKPCTPAGVRLHRSRLRPAAFDQLALIVCTRVDAVCGCDQAANRVAPALCGLLQTASCSCMQPPYNALSQKAFRRQVLSPLTCLTIESARTAPQPAS